MAAIPFSPHHSARIDGFRHRPSSTSAAAAASFPPQTHFLADLASLSLSLSLRATTAVHARALRFHLIPADHSLTAHLLRLYAFHRRPSAATTLLASAPPEPFLYNTLIRSLTAASLPDAALAVFLHMLLAGARPNEFTFPFVLKSSTLLGLLPLACQLHAALLKSNLLSNIFCAAALLDLYSKLPAFNSARQLFDEMPDRNIVVWNSMITAHTQNGLWQEALKLLSLMEETGLEVEASSWNSVISGCVRSGDAVLALDMLGAMLLTGSVQPDSATFNTLLPVIPSITTINRLKELHGFAVRNLEAVDMDSVDEERLWSVISSGYAVRGCLSYASRLFERISLRTTQLCNSMISGFLDRGRTCEAFDVFREMAFRYSQEGRALSRGSLTLILPKCGRASKAGSEIHAYACRKGLESSTSVSNALMAMYARKGDRESAEKVFQRTPEKDVVSWNTIVSSYALVQDSDRAFKLFQEMLADGVQPDEYSFSSVLSGCRYSSYIRQGVAIHGHIIKSGFCQSYMIVQNALMDAYSKSGCVEDARKVFDEMEARDSITWNTIISCYGINARPYEAFSLFDEMQKQGWKPNRVTFIGLLSACSHAGLLDEGLHYFESMTKEHGIVPDVDHYTCIVDNLGRVGQLNIAYQFIKDMPIEPDDCVWSALLSSCRIHGNIELAEIVAKRLIKLDPRHSGYWVLLSNIYADASRWNDVAYVRQAMRDSGVKKSPGYSWIELGGSELHRFLTFDKSHRQCYDIYLALDGLTEQLKDEGYIPLIDSRLAPFDRGTE